MSNDECRINDQMTNDRMPCAVAWSGWDRRLACLKGRRDAGPTAFGHSLIRHSTFVIRHSFFLCASVSLWLASFSHADDWPQWRGPKRDGVSKETGLLKSWPAGGPKLLWT